MAVTKNPSLWSEADEISPVTNTGPYASNGDTALFLQAELPSLCALCSRDLYYSRNNLAPRIICQVSANSVDFVATSGGFVPGFEYETRLLRVLAHL